MNQDIPLNPYIAKQKKLIKELPQRIKDGTSTASLVAMTDDFTKDARMTLTSVLFVPTLIGRKIQKYIIDPLKGISPEFYYYALDSMHITIKNVRAPRHGNPPKHYTPEDIKKAKIVFQSVVPAFSPFSFLLEGLFAFPTSVAIIGYSNDTLQKLVQTLDKELTNAGVPDSKTYFSNSVFFGNSTVCRYTHEPSKQFLNKVSEMEHIRMGEVLVKDVHLITCNSICSKDTRSIQGTYRLQ